MSEIPPTAAADRPRRLLRWTLYGAAALLILLLAGGFALGRYLQGTVGAEHVERLVNDALREATGGLYTASLEDIEWRLGGMSLRLTGLSLMLDRDELVRRDAAGRTPGLLFQLQHATVDVTGVDPWSLLRREGFRAVSLSIDQPLIQISGLEDVLGINNKRREGSGAAPATPPMAPAPPGGEGEAERVEARAPKLRIWNLSINGASLESYRRAERPSDEAPVEETFSMFERFSGVDIEVDDLDLGRPPGDEPRLLFADDLAIRIERYTYTWPDGLHEEAHGPISMSTAGGYVRMQDFNVRPTFERRDRVAEDGSVPTRVDLHIDEVAIEGLDFHQVISRQSFAAGEFRFAGARATVTTDAPAVTSPEESAPGPDAVGAVTAPITGARPGALLTEALSGLPAIAVQRLSLSDVTGRVLVDREDGRWLDQPSVLHELDALDLELTGYRSGPRVAYDPTRPFFSDAASLSADKVVTTLPGRRYRVEMADWRMSDNPGALSMSSIRVEPLFERRALAAAGEPLVDRFEVEAAGLSLEEIDYGELIADVDVQVGRMTLASARIAATGSRGDRTDERSGGRTDPVPDRRTPAQALAHALLGAPDMDIRAIRIEEVDYTRQIDRDGGRWLDEPRLDLSIENLRFHLDDVAHDQQAGYDINRPLLAARGEFACDSLVLALGDGFLNLSLSDVLLASDSDTGTVGSIAVGPASADAGALRQRLRTASVPRLGAGKLTLVGSPVADFVTTGEVRLRSLALESLQVAVLEATDRARPTPERPSDDNTGSVITTLRSLPVVRVDTLRIGDADFGRHVAASDADWTRLPEPTEAIRGLKVELDGLDTDPSKDDRRLLFSDRVVVGLEEMLLSLAEDSAALRLTDLALSSDSDTLTIGGARYSTREVGGNNDYTIGRIELTNVPYGRTFKALIEPRTTDTPVLSAMIDRGTDLRIAGVEGDLDDSRRSLRVGAVTGSARSGDLSVAGIDMRPTLPDADPSTPGTQYRESETLLSFADVRLRGVDFPGLASRGQFVADSLEVDSPSVVLVTGTADASTGGAATAGARPGSGGSGAGPSLAQRISDGVKGLPSIRIDRIRLGDIGFEERRSLEGRPVRDFEQIQLAIDGLDLRQDRDPASPEGVLFAEDIRLDVPRQKTWVDNVGYEVAAGPLKLSTRAGTLDLGSVEYLPPATKQQYLARTRVIEGDRMEFRFGRVGLSGIDFARLLRQEGFYAGGMTVADWSVDILHDKKKPKNPNASQGPKSYPNEAVQRLGMKFGIDRVDLSGGSVKYSERDEEGDRPGELWWDRLAGAITNLSNDPALTSMQTPTVLAVEARMLDQAYLKLTWNLPLLEPGPTMSYSGEVGPLDVTRLSAILEPLEGVRISEGVFDRTWFDIDIRERRATGTFNALYHDVKIQLVNRNTGGRNLGQRILSFAANLILPSNNTNQRGEPERVGHIDWEVPDTVPFFGVFWDAIKHGVIDVAK